MVGFPFEEGVLTPLENDRLNTAFGINPRFSEMPLLWKVVSTVKNIWRKDNAKDNFMPRYSR